MTKKDKFNTNKIFFLFSIIILSQFIIFNESFPKINIILTVNNEIITNHDITKEERYLEILNPNLKNLKDIQKFELAKQSLLKELIKKKEISKFVDLQKENDFADNYLNQIILKLGFKDEVQFKKN